MRLAQVALVIHRAAPCQASAWMMLWEYNNGASCLHLFTLISKDASSSTIVLCSIRAQPFVCAWMLSSFCCCSSEFFSVRRYLAVTQPLNYSRRRRSKRLAMLMILIVWILALAITCPPILGILSNFFLNFFLISHESRHNGKRHWIHKFIFPSFSLSSSCGAGFMLILGWYEPGRRDLLECRYNENKGYVVFSAMGMKQWIMTSRIIQMPIWKFFFLLPSSSADSWEKSFYNSFLLIFSSRLLFPADASHGVRLSSDIVRGCQSTRRHGTNKGPPGKHPLLDYVTAN